MSVANTPERMLIGARVALRPVTQADYELIRMAETTGNDSLIYRQRGMASSPEEWAVSFWRGVLTQWVILDKGSGSPAGVATSYGADFRSGHAYIAGIIFPPCKRQGWPLEGFQLLIDDLFDTFGFRKLYAEMYEHNLKQFASVLQGLAHEEGRLRNHERIADELVDKVTLALYREDWKLARAGGRGLARGDLLRRIRAADRSFEASTVR